MPISNAGNKSMFHVLHLVVSEIGRVTFITSCSRPSWTWSPKKNGHQKFFSVNVGDCRFLDAKRLCVLQKIVGLFVCSCLRVGVCVFVVVFLSFFAINKCDLATSLPRLHKI